MENIKNKTSCICRDKKLLNDKHMMSRMLEMMMTGRKFEEKVFELFGKGLVHGTTHLGVGEEATAIGTTFALGDHDYMMATHRGHAQAIGKGCDVKNVMAEILAKDAGVNHGRGGSMHIADIDSGILGSNGILGASAPIACGAALTIRKKKMKDCISVLFFGDGSANQGAIHESMNLAAAWNLPVLFCLINNGYGMSTPLSSVVKETDLTKRAIAYGIKAFECDGNDVLQVYETAVKARKYVLKHGPALLVEHTYRTSGHSKSDGNLYRTKEEIAEWKAHNPVIRFSNFLIENKLLDEAEIKATDEKTTAVIEEAVTWALNCPDPDVADVLNGVYA